MKVKSESEVAQSCLTLSNPMDSSLPGSSIHGIFQARVLEWVAIVCKFSYVFFVEILLLQARPSSYLTFKLFGEGNGTPLQYSCLENSMDGGA